MKAVKILTVAGVLVGLVAYLPQEAVRADSTKCTIVHRVRSCDYFMVEARSDYAILEWYGGHDPDKDGVLIGDLSSYGMKDFYDETADESIHLYVEDRKLTKVDALERLLDHCE